MKKVFVSIAIIVSAILLGPAWAVALPTLVVENGQLVGATGIYIQDVYYKVEFIDGSIDSLYTDEEGNFISVFDSKDTAILAVESLLDVITGSYDSDPSLVRGIEDETYGCILTPYRVDSTDQNEIINSLLYVNEDSMGQDEVVTVGISTDKSMETLPNPYYTYAVWSLDTSPSPVPEPGTLMLLSLGLLSLAGTARKKSARHTKKGK